jgi:hypothetical protein
MREPFNAGDIVYVTDGYGRIVQRTRVTRVTPTLAVVAHERGERRFSRSTGREVGRLTHPGYISRPTPLTDKQFLKHRTDATASALSVAARKGDPEEIRTAYAAYARLAFGK